ncbi:CoxG family protein [Solimonas terrae]|uniref:Carbon monoxide dehydrogenase subunit G n=1 Tax=Solimonas terrae TaxID=1396819 RepID=A0A6M2BN20_9GAMM|nr:carbon monoxide dehydrogenase subunit G [Solimonas terrae]NGY04052.1 carbon monoxide dehydrogenase subunit G [Solimonas terrae]
MKMSGEQRIAAQREQVWQALNDPDVLKRCIPGCQSLAKESDTRMVATVEIKIGPIGARFNGAVELADINAPDSYTLIMEGQAGTVGFVKSIVKVKLQDDGGNTLLTWDADAQVGGRLAQLGGPIMDATSKQLAARFFSQFANIIAPTRKAAVAGQPVTAGAAGGTVYAPASGGSRIAWLLAVLVAGLVGYLFGRGMNADPHSEWMGISIGLLLVIVGGAGVLLGRRSAAPVVTLDANLLAQLLEKNR